MRICACNGEKGNASAALQIQPKCILQREEVALALADDAVKSAPAAQPS